MITDQEFQELKSQVAFLYKHLGIAYEPDKAADEDALIIREINNANLMAAIKIHQELHHSSMKEAQQYVRELSQRLATQQNSYSK